MSVLEDLESRNGEEITCYHCGGSGQIWQPAEGWSYECANCGGSGLNWQYSNGAIARYYSGPLIGRLSQAKNNGGEQP